MRTKKQFKSILKNAENGNWEDAAKECVEYGFYASDLISMHEERKSNGKRTFKDETDLAVLVEVAMEHRYNNLH